MKPAAGLPRLPLLLLAAVTAPDAAQAALCACLGFGGSPAASLLQGGDESQRPRDCTCITGVKSYAVTPRDDLLRMGEVGLRFHLRKCQRERKELEPQREYRVAAAEAQENNVKEKLGQMKKALEGTKNQTSQRHSGFKDQKANLTKVTDDLEKEARDLKKQYNAEFATWYKGQEDLKKKLSRFWGCNCQKEKPAAASFLTAGRGQQGKPDIMYRMAAEVEDCETAVIKLSDEIDAAIVKEQRATVDLSDGTEKLKRRLEDHERLAKMMNQGSQPMLETLKSRQETLKSIVDAQGSQVKKYKEANKKVKTQLADLDKNLKDCKC